MLLSCPSRPKQCLSACLSISIWLGKFSFKSTLIKSFLLCLANKFQNILFFPITNNVKDDFVFLAHKKNGKNLLQKGKLLRKKYLFWKKLHSEKNEIKIENKATKSYFLMQSSCLIIWQREINLSACFLVVGWGNEQDKQ